MNEHLNAVKRDVMKRLELDLAREDEFVVTLNGKTLEQEKLLNSFDSPMAPSLPSNAAR